MVFGMLKGKITSSGLSDEDKDRLVAELYERSKPAELLKLDHLLAEAAIPLAAEKIIEELFPNLDKLFEQKKVTSPKIVTGDAFHDANWEKNQRVCSARRFDRYFASAISSSLLTPSQRDELKAQKGHPNELLETVREFAADGATDDVIEELELIAHSLLTVAEVESFITALMDWGDEIPFYNWSKSSPPPRILRLCQIVASALSRYPEANLDELISCFERACSNTTGLFVPLLLAETYLRIGDQALITFRIMGLPEDERQQVSNSGKSKIDGTRANLWRKFDEVVKTTVPDLTPLQDRSTFGPLLWKWEERDAPRPPVDSQLDASVSDWPSRVEARAWVKDLISTPQGYARFAQIAAVGISEIWKDDAPFPNSAQMFGLDIIDEFLGTSEPEVSGVPELKAKGEALDFAPIPERERKWALTLLDAAQSEGVTIPYFIIGKAPAN